VSRVIMHDGFAITLVPPGFEVAHRLSVHSQWHKISSCSCSGAIVAEVNPAHKAWDSPLHFQGMTSRRRGGSAGAGCRCR
jgi:hypothetical protein